MLIISHQNHLTDHKGESIRNMMQKSKEV